MQDSTSPCTPPCLVAVDGGGTSCRIAVLRDGVRSDVTTGSANVASDRGAAIQTINDALAELAGIAGLPLPALRKCPAYLGLAGVMSVADGAAVAQALALENGVVADDRIATIKGALEAGDGAVAGIVGFSTKAQPRDYGRFAPWISQAADDGDAIAQELMQSGAAYIAKALRALGWEPGEALCLTGGVGPQYQPFLPAEMAACVTAPKGSGLDGALALAAQIGLETGGRP